MSKISNAFLHALNQHGYSFHQRIIAETALIQDKDKSACPWELLSVEQPVTVSNKNTRIDFILSHRLNETHLVLLVAECKRVNPAYEYWCFTQSRYQRPNFLKRQKMAEIMQFEDPPISGAFGGKESDHIYDIGFILKSDKLGDPHPVGNDKDALEGACGQVTLGMNGLLDLIARHDQLRSTLGDISGVTIIPVIFTTAKLLAAEVDFRNVDLSSGGIESIPDVQEKLWLYYNYWQSPLLKHGVKNHVKESDKWDTIVAREFARTIPIVGPYGIEEFLKTGWMKF